MEWCQAVTVASRTESAVVTTKASVHDGQSEDRTGKCAELSYGMHSVLQIIQSNQNPIVTDRDGGSLPLSMATLRHTERSAAGQA